MYVCRKVKNSQARTGHQRGMGGRETDDDDCGRDQGGLTGKKYAGRGPLESREASLFPRL